MFVQCLGLAASLTDATLVTGKMASEEMTRAPGLLAAGGRPSTSLTACQQEQ